MQWSATVGANGLPDFFGVFGDELIHAVNQGVGQALAHWQGAPFVALAVVFGAAFSGLGDFNQTLAGCQFSLARQVDRPAVKHHVFDPLAQNRV